MNPGFTFSTGVSVPGPFLQPGVHTQAGTQAGKQSHIPYSQQRPSGPGPGQGPASSGQGPGPMNQGPSQGQQPQTQPPSQQALQQSVQLQVQAMSQQQQSPTKPVQQVGMGKSPPHHPGLQQVRNLSMSLLLDPETRFSLRTGSACFRLLTLEPPRRSGRGFRFLSSK